MPDPVSALNRAAIQASHTIRIVDRGPVGQVTLRGDLTSTSLKAAVKAGVGVDVPGPLGAAFGEGGEAVWMSPDELLLLTNYRNAEALVASLDRALSGEHHLALNVSDARAVLTLTGANVAEVLAKGAPVDLSPDAFPPGTTRRTHVAGIAVAFWRKSELEWEIVCFRSFSRHLYDWLGQSSLEGREVGVF